MSSSLTENEQRVLFGLVRYSNATDAELSRRLGIKLPTITSIRRRLFARGYFNCTLQIPNLDLLGCGILASAHFSYHPSQSSEQCQAGLTDLIQSLPEIFWAVNSPGQHVFFQIGESYADVKANLVRVEGYLAQNDILGGAELKMEVFPFRLCSELMFLGFAPVLRRAFGAVLDDLYKDEEMDNGTSTPHRELTPLRHHDDRPVPELSTTERVVLCALVEQPQLTDKALAEHVPYSRYTIGRVRNKLEERGVIRKQHIPQLTKLDLGVLLYSHAPFNLVLPAQERREIVHEVLASIPACLTVQTDYEVLTVDCYPSFDEYHRTILDLTTIYREHRIFKAAPTRLLFALPTTGMWWKLEFAPLVRKLLGVGPTMNTSYH